MATKPLAGHHLMRVRITKRMFLQLQEAAEEASERTDTHVTVSDLVRAAIYNDLLVRVSVYQLENLASDAFDDDEEDEDGELVSVFQNPMLNVGN